MNCNMCGDSLRDNAYKSTKTTSGHQHVCKACHTEKTNIGTLKYRLKVLMMLGSKCNYPDCDWNDPRALVIDHIHGGGSKHRKKMAAAVIYRLIALGELPIEDYQALCSNHNHIKRLEEKEMRGSRTNANYERALEEVGWEKV